MRINCDYCKSDFNKLPNQIKKTQGNYCSRSCAASFNNRKYPKRKKTGVCSICSCSISASHLRCKECRILNKKEKMKEKQSVGFKNRPKDYILCSCGNIKHNKSSTCIDCYKTDLSLKTKRDFEYSGSTNRASRYTRIRENARKIAKQNNLYEKGCKICGYTTHVEICHIKSVKDFDDDTLISEINNLKNLIPLCPNHHWELDHNHIKL